MCALEPLGGDPCKSGSSLPAFLHTFSFLHHNVRGFLSHKSELEALLEKYKNPTLVGLTETYLNPSIKMPKLTGYEIVGRRDRGKKRQKGGSIVLARKEFVRNVVHVANSENAERLWAVIHSDVGPVSFGLWYRPPKYGKILSITSLISELADHGVQKMGTILCGDFNIHHQGWLTYSNSTTPEGKCLFDICCTHQFRECTKVPTREKHLLDLTLTNIGECITCKVVPGVSDHMMILCKMMLPLFSDSGVYREC